MDKLYITFLTLSALALLLIPPFSFLTVTSSVGILILASVEVWGVRKKKEACKKSCDNCKYNPQIDANPCIDCAGTLIHWERIEALWGNMPRSCDYYDKMNGGK